MLSHQLKRASQYVEMLNNTMEDMSESQQKLREAEVDCVMQLRGDQAVKSLQAQLRAWHRYMGKEKEFLVRQGIEFHESLQSRNQLCVSPVLYVEVLLAGGAFRADHSLHD